MMRTAVARTWGTSSTTRTATLLLGATLNLLNATDGLSSVAGTHHQGRIKVAAMPENAKDMASVPPELAEKADAIARGRELVKQVQRSAEALERQVEQAQATLEQTDRVLDRSQQIREKLSDGDC